MPEDPIAATIAAAARIQETLERQRAVLHMMQDLANVARNADLACVVEITTDTAERLVGCAVRIAASPGSAAPVAVRDAAPGAHQAALPTGGVQQPPASRVESSKTPPENTPEKIISGESIQHPSMRAAAAVDADGLKRGPWTDEEDARAIDLLRDGLARGESVNKIAGGVAADLGRPEPACYYRLSKVLRARLEEAPGAGAASAPDHTPAADQAESAEEQPEPTLDEHLDAVTVDLQTYELVNVDLLFERAILGWKAPDIAESLGWTVDMVISTFNRFTRDRQFRREVVAEGVSRRLARRIKETAA